MQRFVSQGQNQAPAFVLAYPSEELREPTAALRIVVDFAYYSHRDWPTGTAFRIGHFLLTSLFVFLSTTYLSLTLWLWTKIPQA